MASDPRPCWFMLYGYGFRIRVFYSMGPFLLNKDPQWDGSGELGFVRTWGWGEGHPRGGWLSIIII